MGDSWINCPACGHRYGSWISACPQCGVKNSSYVNKGLSIRKKIGIALGATVTIFFILVAMGAAANNSRGIDSTKISTTTSPEADANRIVGISEFEMAKMGSMYQADFQLVDKDLAPMTSDAQVSLVVKLKNTSNGRDGQVVYSKTFDVKATDFQGYTRKLTGAQTGKMYLWLIDPQELQGMKQGDYSFGNAILTVSLPNGKSYTADTTIFA